MRILQIIPGLNRGGAERVVLDIANALQRREDIEVKIITFRDKNDYPELSRNIDWEIVPASVRLSVTGKNTLHVDALQRAIESFAPDVIHSHLFEAEIVSRSCHYPQAKWVSHGHGFFPEFLPLTWDTFTDRQKLIYFYDSLYLLSRYKKNGNNSFISVSSGIKSFIEKRFKGPSYLLRNAIDFHLFNKPGEHLVADPLRLISVGRLDANKNQMFLIDIVHALKRRGISVTLDIFGTGSTKPLLEKRIQELNLTDAIRLKGQVDNIQNHYPAYDIYVHAAKKEALGLTLIEAMASGLPVVANDGGGNRDIIVQGKNGFIIKPDDEKEFIDSILALKNDKSLYVDMSRYAMKYAARFDIQTYIDRLLEIYNTPT